MGHEGVVERPSTADIGEAQTAIEGMVDEAPGGRISVDEIVEALLQAGVSAGSLREAFGLLFVAGKLDVSEDRQLFRSGDRPDLGD